MVNTKTQKEKAEDLFKLHHSGKLLVLPNIWEPLGAELLESLGYPAIATASASIAFTNGYDDGENIPFGDLLKILKKIAGSVDIPVTVDIESGYAETDEQLAENIRAVIETGVVGINLEDTDKQNKNLYPVEIQCRRIRLVKKVAAEMDVPLFINARTDVYLNGKIFETPEAKYEEALKRGLAYKEAGGDCFFPVLITDAVHISKLVSNLGMPLNVLAFKGIPELNELQEMGVARVSLGPSFLKVAIQSMKNLALQLRENNGLSVITENDVTTEYVRNLVNKNY